MGRISSVVVVLLLLLVVELVVGVRLSLLDGPGRKPEGETGSSQRPFSTELGPLTQKLVW